MYYMNKEFEQFCDNVRMSKSVIDSIQTKYHGITKCINRNFWFSTSEVNHSLYVGSYGRGTAINASDVDILVMLPFDYYKRFNQYSWNGPSHLLQFVKDTLRQSYPNTKLRGDGQVIVLDYYDICFEVVPCFGLVDGKFCYPDSNDGGSWKITNPRAEIDEINRMNNQSNKNLKRLCRMIRAWNYSNNLGLSGYLIDAVCYDFIKLHQEYANKSYFYYDEMCRDFFKHVSSCNSSYWFMPGSYLLIKNEEALNNKAKKSYNLAKEAIELANKDYDHSARAKWREIFGDRFPATAPV